MPTFARACEKVGADCACKGVDFPRYLLRLCELERIDCERWSDASGWPGFLLTKSRVPFDFMAVPTLNKSLVLELARWEWIDKRENIIALGPSGVGQTHTARWHGDRMSERTQRHLHHGCWPDARTDRSA
ncbi:ATP-binding protein [Undibacterium arcticum]|uniref:ATP-binding protein n=1 Tax=Undibacterium arcticum TaxID=1762892 RepID=A0ABV7F692_9BURK